MSRFASPIVTVLALYGLWMAAVNFGWLKMLSLKFPSLQQNPIVKTIETQIKKDIQTGIGQPTPPTATPSPSSPPTATPSPWLGGGANVQTPFFNGQYNFKIAPNGQQQQPKQPDNRKTNR